MLLVNFAVAVVVERTVAGLVDGVKHGLHRLAVSRTENLRILLPVRNGEPALGICWKLDLALLNPRLQILIGEADARKQDTELIALCVQVRRLLVAGEVAIARFSFFVGEFIHHAELGNCLNGKLPQRRYEFWIPFEAFSPF